MMVIVTLYNKGGLITDMFSNKVTNDYIRQKQFEFEVVDERHAQNLARKILRENNYDRVTICGDISNIDIKKED